MIRNISEEIGEVTGCTGYGEKMPGAVFKEDVVAADGKLVTSPRICGQSAGVSVSPESIKPFLPVTICVRFDCPGIRNTKTDTDVIQTESISSFAGLHWLCIFTFF